LSALAGLAATGAAIGAARWWYPRAIERASNSWLPVGPDGIIRGAEPIALGGGGRGVLILHGFGDTPQSVSSLALELRAHGYTVRAPLLAGHGRSLHEFAASSADQWIVGARAALAELRRLCPEVSIVGQSLGGVIASLLAAETNAVRSLVLLVPYFDVPPFVRRLLPLESLMQAALPYITTNDDRSIRDPVARAASLSFGATTPRLTAELARISDRGRAVLPRLTLPVLYLQAREDNRIAPEVAERAFAAIGSAAKRLEWLDGTGHVIAADFQRERVAQLTGDWLDAR
jgi:carboxylesterase